MRDVVIVLPGIMGSELVDCDRKPIWSVGGGGLLQAIMTLGRSISGLQLPIDIGDEDPQDGVTASRLMPALHVIPGLWRPIAGYSGLLQFLTGRRFHLLQPDPLRPELIPNLIPFPYDWRLSCRLNGARLAKVAVPALERWRSQPGMGDAQLVLVCHSMGGLIARWFLENEGGSELTRALITIGTPHRGSLKALSTLVNGIEHRVGPLRLSLTSFARSLPSLHQLLPQYRCVDGTDQRRTILDAGAPGLDGAMVRDAAAFHAEINPRQPAGYALHKIVGIRQPTMTTARWKDGRVVPLRTIDDRDQGGDGTVARMAAEPVLGRGEEVHEVADQHGELHETRSALDLIDGILTRRELVYESPWEVGRIGVEIDDVHVEGQPVPVRVTGLDGRRLVVNVLDEDGAPASPPVAVPPDGMAELPALPAGAYRTRVRAPVTYSGGEVTHPFLVWPAEVEGVAAR